MWRCCTGLDGGGSLRVPASMCGVLGLKPTVGRFATSHCPPTAYSIASFGPIAATAADIAIVHAVICNAGKPWLTSGQAAAGVEQGDTAVGRASCDLLMIILHLGRHAASLAVHGCPLQMLDRPIAPEQWHAGVTDRSVPPAAVPPALSADPAACWSARGHLPPMVPSR